MNKGLIAALLSGMFFCETALAQVVDLGIPLEDNKAETTEKRQEEKSKELPTVDDLPEIKDLRATPPDEEQTAQSQGTSNEEAAANDKNAQTTEPPASESDNQEKESGLFSFFNMSFFGKNDDIAKEAAQNKETYTEALIRKANEGSVEAQLSLGYMYLYGSKENNIKQDYQKSFEYYNMAAQQGNDVAINNLGSLLYSGIGTKRNPYKAAKLFEKAAELGNIEAALNLAFLYISGSGVAQNNSLAIKYFTQAAAGGNVTAKFMLGYAYYRGFIVPQDFKQAAANIRAAADAGLDEAQFFLGLMYLNGEGITQNYGNAVNYFNKALYQGNINAALRLADIYEKGIVYTQSIIQAHVLYNIASVNGYAEAAGKRDELAKKMKIEDILKAQATAEGFKPAPTEYTSYVRKTFGENIFGYIAEQMPEQLIENKASKDEEQKKKNESGNKPLL